MSVTRVTRVKVMTPADVSWVPPTFTRGASQRRYCVVTRPARMASAIGLEMSTRPCCQILAVGEVRSVGAHRVDDLAARHSREVGRSGMAVHEAEVHLVARGRGVDEPHGPPSLRVLLGHH